MMQTFVTQGRSVQREILKGRQAGDVGQSSVRNLGGVEREMRQTFEVFQMLQTGVGDPGVVQPDRF